MSRHHKTHQKTIRKGVSIYKTESSPFWQSRIWIKSKNKYVVRSTQEISRIDAIESVEEIIMKLKENPENTDVSRTASNLIFSHFAESLMKQQSAMSGKSRSPRFAKDDERIIQRKGDGLIAYFGSRNINDITTYDLRDYLSFLDENRNASLSSSSKTKHLTIIGKIFKIAYEKDVLDRLPLIPKVSTRDNPRPSFSEKEYKLLLKTTKEVIQEQVKLRGVLIDDELYYFIVFLVHSFMRPVESEIFSITHQDVSIEKDPKRLKIKINDGKTGFRYVSTMPDAVDFYTKLQTLKPFEPTDYLFFSDYPNRNTAIRNVNRQFNYILDRCNLKEMSSGETRSVYALRHYSLQTRLTKSKGKVNIFNLAKNAGTSVEQLERFYLKNIELNDELIENLQTF
jgi:site-specific recombinase XerD